MNGSALFIRQHRKHSAWFTWELRIEAKREKKKKPIKIKCLLRAKITKTGFKTIVFLINQYWNSSNHPTHTTAVTVFLKMSKLKMTEKEIPGFIKSVSGGKEEEREPYFHDQPHRNSRIIKEHAQKHTCKHRSDLSSLCLSKKTSLLSLSQQNVTYLNCKCILQFFVYSWVLLKVLLQVLRIFEPT